MYCPFCACEDTKVTDSRWVSETNTVRRRRSCSQCNERFTSYESIDMAMPKVIKKDQTRVPFDGQKLREGIELALQKRPIPVNHIDAMIARLIKMIRFCGEKEIPSAQIGEWVMQELRVLDAVAYVRFSSVYRRFENAEEFARLLDQLKTKKIKNKIQLSTVGPS